MQHFKVLRTISFILGFALTIFGCAINKAQSYNSKIDVKADAVPEGICFTFDNIPSETVLLDFCIFEYGQEEELANNELSMDISPLYGLKEYV